MTDKVQKIRDEVERLFKHVKDSNFESDSGAFYYLKDLLDYIDSLQEEPVSNDLKVALEDYAYQVAYDLSHDWLKENATWDEVETAVKLGAQWQKQQLMKDAVDGVVFTKLDDGSIMVRTHYFKSDKIDYLDEVKLIIIKEE